MMQQQQQQLPLNVIEFQAGVTACLRSWSVLKTAIEQGWGNPVKAEEIRSTIFQCMDFSNRNPKKPLSDPYDMEDFLVVFMEDEYSIVLEDDSERQIADIVFQLYEQCCTTTTGSIPLARQLLATALNHSAIINQYPVKIQSPDDDEMNDDDDDGSDDDNNDNGETMDMEDDTTNQQQPKLMDSQQQQQQQRPVFGSTGTQTPAIVASTTTAPIPDPTTDVQGWIVFLQNYIHQPLFVSSSTVVNNNKPKIQRPVRQLGEAAPTVSTMEPEVDDDGFAPVQSKKKVQEKRKQQIQYQPI